MERSFCAFPRSITQPRVIALLMEKPTIYDLIEEARASGTRYLTEPLAKAFLSALGIPIPSGGVAHSEGEAEAIAHNIGRPVVLKIIAPGVLHKSEIDGVIFPVDPADVRCAFRRLVNRVRSEHREVQISGILVEEYVKGGVECILGLTRVDPFGPVLMFGIGGVLVEAIQDVSFRLAPLLPEDAEAMLTEIRGARYFHAFRNRPAVNRFLLVQAILAVGRIVSDPVLRVVREVEINPLLAGSDRVVAADAVVILEG